MSKDVLLLERRFDVDWVRVLAFALLVPYHVGMYYVTWGWHIKSPETSSAIEPLMFLTSPWRLSLLFVVSGIATRFMLHKRSKTFVWQRSWRLLVPLVFGMLVVVVPQAYYQVLEQWPDAYHQGYWTFWGRYLAADQGFCRGDDCLILPTWNHLWFVAYLWAYSMVFVVLLRLFPAVLARLNQWICLLFHCAWGWLLLIGYLFLIRMTLMPAFESTHALVDDWYNHALYFFWFLLGYSIAFNQKVWDKIERVRWLHAALALFMYAFIAWYFGHYHDDYLPSNTMRTVQRVAWVLMQWGSIFAIFGWVKRFNPKDSVLLRWLTTAIFPLYILHQTIIIVLAYWFKPLNLSPVWEGTLLIALTFGLSLLAVILLRKVAFLRPLFGMKYRMKE